jgi:hypothetical protein
MDLHLETVPTIGDGSCFFHAVLMHDPIYLRQSLNGRQALCAKVREILARLSFDDWMALSNGLVARIMLYQAINESNIVALQAVLSQNATRLETQSINETVEYLARQMAEIEQRELPGQSLVGQTTNSLVSLLQLCYHTFRQKLANPREYVDEIMMEYVADRLRLRIYIIDNVTNKIVRVAGDGPQIMAVLYIPYLQHYVGLSAEDAHVFAAGSPTATGLRTAYNTQTSI